MTLSNHTVTLARLWHKYLIILAESGVKAPAVCWYMRHAEAYAEAARGRRIAIHTAAIVESWLEECAFRRTRPPTQLP